MLKVLYYFSVEVALSLYLCYQFKQLNIIFTIKEGKLASHSHLLPTFLSCFICFSCTVSSYHRLVKPLSITFAAHSLLKEFLCFPFTSVGNNIGHRPLAIFIKLEMTERKTPFLVFYTAIYNGPFQRFHAVAPWHTSLCKYWQIWADFPETSLVT